MKEQGLVNPGDTVALAKTETVYVLGEVTSWRLLAG